jgi:DNA-binding NarL/FixJ family response regulator
MAGGRVVLADDDVLLREGIARILTDAGYEVVGQADDATGLEELVREQVPDLAVVDIRMPPTNTTEGLVAASAIRAEFPQVGILLLSAHVELETAVDLLNSGERVGYLLKRRVRTALVQELVVQRRQDDPLAELTPREREVLALMAEGRSNSGIAHRLWVSESAVEKNVRGILAKLHLPAAEDDHRRVLAVLTFLGAR